VTVNKENRSLKKHIDMSGCVKMQL